MSAEDDPDDSYVAFTRLLLEDMARGIVHSAHHYAQLFPACADQIRADLARHHAAEPAEAPRRDRIGRYAIVGELASGGMASLLLARDPEGSREVVIKTAKPGLVASDARTIERLRREAQILKRLDHEAICPVLDIVAEGDRIFVVMPRIEGETLEARVSRATAKYRDCGDASIAWTEIAASGVTAVLHLMESVARAIHEAHEKGVIHRDLKPGNIMVRGDGRPVVLDFGLAVDLSDAGARRITVRGDVLGTPSYMASEQVRGDFEATDRRTDVYALGVILFELLTFRRAFQGSSADDVFRRVLDGGAEGPRAFNRAISRDLDALCRKAMEVEPRHRYATAENLAEDLRRVRASERTAARPVSALRRLLRRLRG